MELQLKQTHRRLEAAHKLEVLHAQSGDDYAKTLETNRKLRQKNEELEDIIEELQAMNDILKSQVSQSRGISPPLYRESLPPLVLGRTQ